MRGQRIHGQESAFRSARNASLVILLGAVLLSGCGPDERAARDEGAATSPLPTTSDQIARAAKADYLNPPEYMAGRSRATVAAPAGDAGAAAGNGALARFYGALRALERGLRHKPVTILHLGDSHIASDRFTGDLRDMFQKRFGDAGRGLMMPGYPFGYYRARGVRFAKNGKWSPANSFKGAGGLFGLTGVRLTAAKKDATLSLTSQTGPFEWAEVSFLSGPKQGTASFSVDGVGQDVATKKPKSEVQRVRIEHKGMELSVRVRGDGPVTVLSWAVGHNRPGVRYVNLGIPGATADTPRLWDAALVASDVAALAPDLIVLGFGTNEGFDDRLDIAAYEVRVNSLADDLLQAAPHASLAIIGPADGARFPKFAKGRKSAGCRALDGSERRDYAKLWRSRSAKLARWHAPPSLNAVRHALARVATRRQAHYWDWAGFMGGPCAVHGWVKAVPPLAMVDHVHITGDGAKRSAQAFFASLMEGYATPDEVASRSGADRVPVRVSR